jgi:hypothetical protein
LHHKTLAQPQAQKVLTAEKRYIIQQLSIREVTLLMIILTQIVVAFI